MSRALRARRNLAGFLVSRTSSEFLGEWGLEMVKEFSGLFCESGV